MALLLGLGGLGCTPVVSSVVAVIWGLFVVVGGVLVSVDDVVTAVCVVAAVGGAVATDAVVVVATAAAVVVVGVSVAVVGMGVIAAEDDDDVDCSVIWELSGDEVIGIVVIGFCGRVVSSVTDEGVDDK